MTAPTPRFTLIAWVGRVLAGVPLNSIRKCSLPEGTFYAKRRRWYGACLVLAGNLYLRLQGAHVRFCSRREWLQWENDAIRTLAGMTVIPCTPCEMLLPEVPGKTLHSLLSSGQIITSRKLRLFVSAVEALRKAHQQQLRWPDGCVRTFSHADATSRNVICDPTADSAFWIDCESLHDSRQSEEWRRADDLRALLYSSAEAVDLDQLEKYCRAAVRAYPEAGVLSSLRQQIRKWRRKPIAYHLAQGRLGFDKRMAMDRILSELLTRAAWTNEAFSVTPDQGENGP